MVAIRVTVVPAGSSPGKPPRVHHQGAAVPLERRGVEHARVVGPDVDRGAVARIDVRTHAELDLGRRSFVDHEVGHRSEEPRLLGRVGHGAAGGQQFHDLTRVRRRGDCELVGGLSEALPRLRRQREDERVVGSPVRRRRHHHGTGQVAHDRTQHRVGAQQAVGFVLLRQHVAADRGEIGQCRIDGGAVARHLGGQQRATGQCAGGDHREAAGVVHGFEPPSDVRTGSLDLAGRTDARYRVRPAV